MDSGGNSGSMQSSSTGGGGGGDEAEYDSSSHAFFHVGGGGSGSGVQPPSQQQHQSLLFDSLSNFLSNDNHNNNNPFSTPLSSSRSNQNPSSSSLLNLDILLQNPSSTIQRSQLNNFNSLMTSSSPSPHLNRVNSQNPSLPMNSTTDHHHQANIINNFQPNWNPKKRSRASRRAPTTVLTTDTSNFRAMVQEFTGIPTQPFTSSSSLLFPPSNRLDLFSNSSTTSTVRSGGGVDSSLLLRPFAQKPIQVPPFLSSSTRTSAGTANPNVSSSSSSNSFQLVYEQLGFPSKNNQSLLNMQNNNNPSLIPYQSLLLQPNSNRNENDDARTNISGGGVGLPNLVTSDGLIRNASSSWEDEDHHLRSLNGNYNNRHHQQRVIMNADKGSTTSNQNVSSATRGEGMVDSWICSSE